MYTHDTLKSLGSQFAITDDATYNGRPLGRDAYRMHLDILEAYAAGRSVPERDNLAHHEAMVAVGQARLVECSTCAHGGTRDFHWCRYTLTLRGKVYLGQRLPA